MHRVDPARLDLAREFKERPLGPYSADLQKLLKLLRWEAVEDRFLAVQPEHEGPWFLARTTGTKGRPIEIFRSRPYPTMAEAHWAVFRKRWEKHTGVALILDPREREDPAQGGELTCNAARQPLLGYADKFSVENGQRVAFKVSSELAGTYRARILRIRCGDRGGSGFKASPVEGAVKNEHAARTQRVSPGSYIEIDNARPFALKSFSLVAYIWPTTPRKGVQALLGNWADGRGYALAIDAAGSIALRLGDGAQTAETATITPLLERHWYLVAASFDAASGEAWVAQRPLLSYARDDTSAERAAALKLAPARGGPFRIAAWSENGDAGALYNGKIDSPIVLNRAMSAAERSALLANAEPPRPEADIVAAWDFAKEIPTTRIIDISPHERDGSTVNLPTRAMKGWNWDGSEYAWMHKPEHYGAIHFHDDDLYDCAWETDFSWSVPKDLPSGLYCAHIEQGGCEDFIPVVVRPPKGTARAPLALLLPSASYWAYANTHHLFEWREREHVNGLFAAIDPASLFLHEHPEYGCSLYDRHSDGSGVCYSSRLRPLMNMRPHGRLWQLPADTHIIDWLEEKKIAFDVITEDDLDAEGPALLAPYRCVMTGTHPEYPSKRMIDAFARFQSEGGRFIYMGGNGFYWRVSYHPSLPGVIEMRRAEDGIRSWLAEGGEYYHGFTGELGGMWRRMGHAPQSVAGTGMTAQGFDRSTYFERTAASFDPRAAFIFEGIGKDERIGDFGRIGGGAAGSEVDRADIALGTPPHALIVAAATDFSAAYHWMKEELTHTHSAITGETCPFVRCDMVFYETPKGGAVFSTSSIAWA
ncbi:MAG: LamG domain-containing protein, partial [Alphaproteobacteria bacterium]|nr:LamG domain-containing protein [Alphaproteobacteria bacterium]